MSRRLILALFLSLATVDGVAAQDLEVERLRRRVAALEARRATLAAAIARRDSLLLLAQRPVVVGTAPLFVRVPEWAAPFLEPALDSVVQEATERYGEAFHRSAPETLTVAYRPLGLHVGARTGREGRIDTTRLREAFLAARRWDIKRMATERVERIVGPTLLRWIGGRFDGRELDVGRRQAVRTLLAGAPGGMGDRCLGGETRACLDALERESGSRAADLRGSLFRYAMDRAGTTAWQRLGASTGRSAEELIEAATGRPYAVLVAEWGESLRVPPASDRPPVGRALLAIAWSLIGIALFSWRLSWIRV